KDQEFYKNYMDKQYAKYNVVTHHDLIPENIYEVPSSEMGVVIVEGKHPDIALTLGEYFNALRSASQEREDISLPQVRSRILKKETDSRVMYAAAQDAKLLTRKKDDYQIQQTSLSTILSFWYSEEVSDKITVSQEEIQKYYNDNLGRLMIQAHREIRQFVAKNEKDAKKHQKAIAGFLKKGQTTKIIDLIRAESLKPEGDGILPNVYANGIIPGIGRDQVYNNKVWETKPGTVSDIFTNSKDEIVFFYITSETPAVPRPMEDVAASLRSNVHRTKANELFDERKEQLLEEYAVVIHYDRLVSRITPEELFVVAEDAQRRSAYADAVSTYDQIITDFAGSDHAYRALFMKGFVLAENMGNTDKAIEVFSQCLSMNPKGDLNEAIEFMMESLLSGELPEFMQAD
ncbi:MAG: peptidyl-prolyl cis-trans isomerase, partial [Candidatus Cloacimonetes bacterium]|nr:peptidyl-prolyl cis-trans isomerase [Candidatus Cloacimonadota bacterium]